MDDVECIGDAGDIAHWSRLECTLDEHRCPDKRSADHGRSSVRTQILQKTTGGMTARKEDEHGKPQGVAFQQSEAAMRIEQGEDATGEDLVHAVPGHDADRLLIDYPGRSHGETEEWDRPHAARTANQRQSRYHHVELHLYAKRPEVLAVPKEVRWRKIANEEQIPDDLLSACAVPKNKDEHGDPGERNDAGNSLAQKFRHRHALIQEGHDQEARQAEEDRHPGGAGKGVQFERRGPQRKKVRPEYEENADRPPAVEYRNAVSFGHSAHYSTTMQPLLPCAFPSLQGGCYRIGMLGAYDSIRVINLVHRHDRRREMDEQLRRAHLTA